VSGTSVTAVHLATGTTQRATVDPSGRWVISDLPSGAIRVTVQHPGFRMATRNMDYNPARPSRYDVTLDEGAVSQTVEVTASASEVSMSNRKALPQPTQSAPSANIVNLQRRVAGVLPIAVDVPRSGNSYRFVRPLVVDEETTVSFSYRTK
jgi:hypothetical protein